MWTRVELKSRAKGVLRINYWKALLVSLVIIIAGSGSGSGGGIRYNNNNSRNFNFSPSGIVSRFVPESLSSSLFTFLFISISILTLMVFLYRILLGYHLEIGGRRYFVKAAKEHTGEIEELGFAFSSGGYVNIIKAMVYRAILVFLWSLLLIIPGIIKSYAYRMVPYILADNPQLSYKRALEISNQMTMDQKFDIFALDVSFIGWYLLGALAFGIGTVFVTPYDNATNAELYLVLRQNALDTGICSYEELLLDI